MPNAETERNGHEGQCAARIGTDCSPPHVWHLATPLNERNSEFFLLKGFNSTHLKGTRFFFPRPFQLGPTTPWSNPRKTATPSLPAPTVPRPCARKPDPWRPAWMRRNREPFANGRVGARTSAVGRERFANGVSGRKLLLEVHESAALFTAGDLSLLK